LYSHSWLVLDDDEHISTKDGSIIHDGRRTAGNRTELLPSSWRTSIDSSTINSKKYNSVGVRSGKYLLSILSSFFVMIVITM
jgi:hypothetical protein